MYTVVSDNPAYPIFAITDMFSKTPWLIISYILSCITDFSIFLIIDPRIKFDSQICRLLTKPPIYNHLPFPNSGEKRLNVIALFLSKYSCLVRMYAAPIG